ncbi:signal peptidase II [Novosphingobium aerophilum]|uniref:signal peptidase II n=1 Tax=Novosphingobium TaxID=165696 RepID=UPI0006C88C31|nr:MULTISPECIES: signal peptidase II [unclassified Novosphingobium]KPH57408.1 peptidase A8 [Novosphingobium sp. ST904]MPS67399.1 signal peptidase II [Novosphingobium sp.]WRT94740.1 signal peptidase II [Novosphingobium sp. RL4]
MSIWRKRLIGLLIAAVVFVIDQGFKAWVVNGLRLRDVHVIELLPIFDLRWTKNLGVSLGLFTADSPEGRWALVAMTAAIALFVFIWMLRERKLGEIAALALVLGGALGNIRDRFTMGYVIDYADLHFGNFRPFLIFNIADVAITVGVLIILARSLLSRDKPETNGGHDTAPGAAPEI